MAWLVVKGLKGTEWKTRDKDIWGRGMWMDLWTWIPKCMHEPLSLTLVLESICPPGAIDQQLHRMAHLQRFTQPLSSGSSVFVQCVCGQRGPNDKDVGYTKVQKQGLPLPRLTYL